MNWTEQRIKITKLFIGAILKQGKKIRAERIFQNILIRIAKIFNKDPYVILMVLIKRITFKAYLESKYKSGIVYKLPSIVKTENGIKIGMKLILKSTLKRKERTFEERFFNEICDILNNQGMTIKARDDIYKTVLANRSLLKFK